MFLFLLVAKFHEIGLDEIVDATIHHPLYVGGLVVGAVVFDPTVVEHITAYLRPPFDFLLAGLDLGLLGHTVLQLLLVKNRAQLAHGILAVLGLVAGLGILDEDFLLFARYRGL